MLWKERLTILKKNKKLIIKSATFYPIILAFIATLAVTFSLIFVMPTFVGMFQTAGILLPLPTRILIVISDALLSYWYISLAVLAVVIRQGTVLCLTIAQRELFTVLVQ